MKKIGSILLILLGNLIYAFTAASFILPANVMSSGTTGIAMVVQRYLGLPIPTFVFIFNIAMLCLGWAILGKTFALTTILSSLVYPFMLQGVMTLLNGAVITENMLLNVVFGGMGIGLALGIVIRCGASTGGMDIPPLVLHKFFRIPVSVSLWVFDFLIILTQLSYHPIEDLLYGILLLLSTSITMNRVLLAGTSRTEVKIISPKSSEIAAAILNKVDRGVTLLHGEGGFRREPTEVVLCVLSNYELPRVEQIARGIDPDCFVIISRVTEVWGRGFTGVKKYEESKDDN